MVFDAILVLVIDFRYFRPLLTRVFSVKIVSMYICFDHIDKVWFIYITLCVVQVYPRSYPIQNLMCDQGRTGT